METDDSFEEMQAKLRSVFTTNTPVGPYVGANLFRIHQIEEGYEERVVHAYKGYRLLHQCLASFLLESLELGSQNATIVRSNSEWYRPILRFGGNIFSRLRAAEILWLHGYPLDGFSLIRDLKDRSIYLAALLKGKTSLKDLMGLDAKTESDDIWEAQRLSANSRRQEQSRVKRLFLNDLNDLSTEAQGHLQTWQRFFDSEVHMSLLTFFSEEPGVLVGPQVEEGSKAMYMNRSLEVAWCLLRTMPIYQPGSGTFGDEWARKWRLLDENLSFAVRSVAEGKPIIKSVVDWVESRFDFDPSCSYQSCLTRIIHQK